MYFRTGPLTVYCDAASSSLNLVVSISTVWLRKLPSESNTTGLLGYVGKWQVVANANSGYAILWLRVTYARM